MYRGHWRIPLGGNFLWLLLLVAIIVVFILFFISRTKTKITGLSDNQAETLENLEAQIMSMLFQNGGNMNQIEISNSLDLPLDIVSEKLLKMEKEGLIVREWATTDYTYYVKKTS